MTVFLWTNIIYIHEISSSLVTSYHTSCITVNVIFFGTTPKVFYYIQTLRYTETHTNTRYFELIFILFLFTGSVSGKMSIFLNFSPYSFLISCSKFHVHIYYSIRIYSIIHQVLVASR